MNLEEQVEAIKSRDDLAAFVRLLLESLVKSPDSWENVNLEEFLDALAAWVDDMEGYFSNRGEPCPQYPDWKLIGKMLLAARIYE